MKEPEGKGLTFGQAIEAVKQGRCIARNGWNWRGMYVWQAPGITLSYDQPLGDPRLGLIVASRGETTVHPYLCMFTAHGSVQVGWLASQSDMLSEDWEILVDAE